MRNRKFHQRRGITLLFVVSMIVLFLLMGTTFVVVSNNYLRASKKRARIDIHTVDGAALVEKAAYELIRGPSLDNKTSPFRGHDLLSDMYGFGLKALVDGAPRVAAVPISGAASNGQLIELELKQIDDAGDEQEDHVTNLRTGDVEPLAPNLATDGIPGLYNGQILTFVSGPASGISARIVDYQFEYDSSTGDIINRKFVIAPNWSDSGKNWSDPMFLANLADSTIVINGRAFSGYGAGGFDPMAAETTAGIGAAALTPYRVGEDRAAITNATTGYLADFRGPNESYDGPDFQNMFLSGKDDGGDLIASFRRTSLSSDGGFAAFQSAGLNVDCDNDGTAESIWIDKGMPVQSNGAGLYYKPLVAYHVVDLDGRLNLNTCGNLADMINGPATANTYPGQGYGPAEISLHGFLDAGDYDKILQGDDMLGFAGRYGYGVDGLANSDDEYPGGSGRDEWSLKKLFGYPLGTDTLGGFFKSSPIDIRGRFPIATPLTSAYADLNDATINIGLPQTDFTLAVAANDTFNNSPYETNFAPRPFSRWEVDDDDQLFTANELEAVLRPSDIDSNLLDNRLAKLLMQTFTADDDKRDSVTTDSYEIPMAPFLALNGGGSARSLLELLQNKLDNSGAFATKEDLDVYFRQLLSSEMLAGLKMNINRPFGNGRDDNSNNVIDDPDEGFATEQNLDQAAAPEMDLNNDFMPGTNDDLARYEFAKQLYILTLLVCEDDVETTSITSTEDYRKAIAQWAINVVDFRDPDSINTPFEFDLNPWDGWEVDGIVTAGETNSGDRWLVWGAERPELLITETFAHHDRRTEDLGMDDGGNDDVADGDMDFDSRLVPHSSLFIELYNPWTQSISNQLLPSELAADPANPIGVDLQRRTPGNDPVWRIAVGLPAKTPLNPDKISRSIYFTDLGANPSNVTDGGNVEFYSTLTIPPIEPGVFAVVGSAGPNPGAGSYRTTFGRRSDADELSGDLKLDETRSITLDPSNDPTDDQIIRNDWDNVSAMQETMSKGVAIVIDGPRSLSISDPDAGYPMDPALGMAVEDGWAYTIPVDTPLDPVRRNVAVWTNGTTDRFATLSLQRLANPLLDWDKDTNPYLTIDVSEVDLLAFNGLQDPSSHDNPLPNEAPAPRTMAIDADTDGSSLERGESQTAPMLFARDPGNENVDGAYLSGTDMHNFSYDIEGSFGRTNLALVASGEFYPWLTWNNRPYVSQYELANVPYTSQEDLTAAFSLYDTEVFDPYTASSTRPLFELGSRFGHLLNFHGHDDSTSGPERGNFYRLFDYTEVPSRYVGTEMWLNGNDFVNHPFNYISHYRYPGKINLNTMNKQTYETLMADYLGELSYDTFNDSRWGGSSYFRPYRNSGEGNFVPSGVDVEENVDCGLFRRGDSSDTVSLFDFEDTTAEFNSERSAYFRNAMRQRLGNLVTTRSSVFAIWITIGYFEVDETGALVNVGGGGNEIGAETGEVKRNRGFYIYDRSIPVAFEPGQNHNVDRGILVRSIIE